MKGDWQFQVSLGFPGRTCFTRWANKNKNSKDKAHIHRNWDNRSNYSNFFFVVKNKSVSIWVSNILPHHGLRKEYTLFYILLLKHFPISSPGINFAITRVKATIVNDPLCSTLSREEPCEALDKNVCLPDQISVEAKHSSGWASGEVYMGFENSDTIPCYFLETM